jgi:hypothetical protein
MRLHKSHMFLPSFARQPGVGNRPANHGSGKPRKSAVRPGFAAAIRDEHKEATS